jgi:hypothetical protein
MIDDRRVEYNYKVGPPHTALMRCMCTVLYGHTGVVQPRVWGKHVFLVRRVLICTKLKGFVVKQVLLNLYKALFVQITLHHFVLGHTAHYMPS